MKNNENLIVLDKSYLQGCQPSHLEEITRNNRLLATAELFYEISSSPQLRNCFNKLLPFRKSIDIIEHLGIMYKFEIDNNSPCTPLSKHFLPGELNPNFNFQFNEPAQKRIKDFGQYHETEKPKDFEEVIFEIKTVKTTYKAEDLTERDKILEIYKKLSNPSFPSAEKLNEDWAIFRKLQVDLMASKEYLNSYTNGKFNINEERKSHNQIDFRICIFGLLSRAIATEDNLIKRYFKLFCPDGIIYSLNQSITRQST